MIFNASPASPASTPVELCKLFTFVHEAHNKYTRSSLINLVLPSVNLELAKSKFSYCGALLFNFLPSDRKLTNNYTYSTCIKKLKTFFRNLDFEVDHLECFSGRKCKHSVKCACYM